MKPLPLPLRVAAGLAVTTAERVRELPKQVIGFPVTVASQLLQITMRVQQHVTELAVKGDDALSTLRPVEDTPSWATFDEDTGHALDVTVTRFDNVTPIDALGPDIDADLPRPRSANNGHRPEQVVPDESAEDAVARDPWEEEERALAADHTDGEFDSGADPEAGPAGIAGYDELSLPQLRARLRRLSLAELEELLDHERSHENRPSFVGMLARRIGNVQKAAQDPEDNGGAGAGGR